MSSQQSSNKRAIDKLKSDDKFGDFQEWEAELGYVHPTIECW